MFIGREKERRAINEVFAGGKSGNIIVYGPRRVGKTALLRESFKDFNGICIWYECVKGSLEYNVEMLAKSVAIALDKSYIAAIRDVFDLFKIISESGKHVVIVLDEYPYLKESKEDGVVDSYFQKIIDSHYQGLSVVICGSFISMMKDLLQKENPLFGRFNLVMQVEPFDYLDASRFYDKLSVREKISMYSVFGGYPFVLELLDASKSVMDNIKDLLLQEYSPVRETVENSLLAEIGKMGLAREIIARIGNSKLKYNEIVSSLSIDANGSLDRELKRLITMQIVEKHYPINRKDDKKKSFYEISDNLLRFYYCYVFPYRSNLVMLDPSSFYDLFISKSLDTYVSYRFEGIVREYFARVMKTGNLQGIIDIGTYWYDDKVNHTNGEFDCALKHIDGSYRIYEVKYFKRPMSQQEVDDEAQKIHGIKDFSVGSIGFVSSAGFEKKSTLYDEVDGSMLYGLLPNREN